MFAVSDIDILIRQPISQIAVYCLTAKADVAKDTQLHKMKILVVTFFSLLQNTPLIFPLNSAFITPHSLLSHERG